MLYHYLASDKNGKIIEADFDADNIAQILQHLAGKELRPLSIKSLKQSRGWGRGLFGGISVSDKVFLTRYLSLMLRVGTDLLSAINILIVDFDKPAMKNLLLEVRDNLSRGQPLYLVFARYPKVFSPVFINLVKAAEASGNLQRTLEDLSQSLERESRLRGRIRAAMIYPIILAIAALTIITFLVTFALPRIAKVFLESGFKPPLFSRIVFGIGLFVNDHLVGFFTVLLLVLAGGYYFLFQNKAGRNFATRIFSHLPVVRNVYRELAIQRFAATLSSLMKAGLPIIETIRISAEVVGENEFRLALRRVADEGLAKGLTIGEAFRREAVFPRVVTNLIAISEKAGHLEDVLQTLSEFYSANVDSSVQTLVSLLEPALLLTMGLMVASIALSIIIPIYQLTSSF